MIMRYLKISIFLFILVTTGACITQFFPETNEDKNLLVVEGVITDRPEVYTIKLSMSMQLGETTGASPLSGCIVRVSDDLGNLYDFSESGPGIYTSDPGISEE